MIQPRTQTREYWEHEFSLTETDIEQLYNHFLEVEKPQATGELVRAVMHYRVAEEKNNLLRRVKGHAVYQPKDTYAVGDKLVFPAFEFAQGAVTGIRDGHNPQEGTFKVVKVDVEGKAREFVSELASTHVANLGDSGLESLINTIDPDEIVGLHNTFVESQVVAALEERDEFVYLGGMWFVKALLTEVNVGHLHLAEAVLDMSAGGPLTTNEIVVHLDMDASAETSAQLFSLNNALLNDERFDEVAPKGQVAWYLRRMEPEAVNNTPERLQYEPVPYDKALLSTQLELLEREIADEWSNLESADFIQQINFSLIYPHRLMGTLPLNNTISRLLPLGRSPRQILTMRDAETNEDMQVWVIKEGRYIYGLKEWYEENKILVGSQLSVKKGPEPGVVLLDFDRRKPRREDVRLANVVDGRIRFELQRRSIACGYDDLLTIGTDFTAAIDAVRKRAISENRSIATLIAQLLPELAQLSLQNAVHSKTIYSAINMLRRVPPGPVFAELVKHPAFVAVGDQYWRFEQRRWQKE